MAYSCVVRYQEHIAVNASAGTDHCRNVLGYQGRSPWLVSSRYSEVARFAGREFKGSAFAFAANARLD